jgi:hypothetical protein
MARFFKAWSSKYSKNDDEKGHGSYGSKGSGSRGSRGSRGSGSRGSKGSGSRGSRGSYGRGSRGSKGSGSRGSRGSRGSKGSGSRGSCGSRGSNGHGSDDNGDDIAKMKFFYSTVNEDGSTSELSPEGWAQVVEVELPEGTSFAELPLEEAEAQVLADLEEKGVEVGEIYQVTLVGTDADGNEAYYDYTLVEDEDGNLSLEPMSEDDDLLAQLSTGDAENEEHPEDEEYEDEDDSNWC